MLPGNLGDRNQTLDAAEIDEGPELLERDDRPLHRHPLPELFLQGFPLLGLLLFENGPVRNDDVSSPFAVFDDPEVQPLADPVRRRPRTEKSHLGERAETPHIPGDTDIEAALDLFFDQSLDGNSAFGRIRQKGPARFAAADLGREPLLIMLRGEEIGPDGLPLPDRHISRRIDKFPPVQKALVFSAHVNEHPLRGDLDDHRLHALARLQPALFHPAFFQQFGETLLVPPLFHPNVLLHAPLVPKKIGRRRSKTAWRPSKRAASCPDPAALSRTILTIGKFPLTCGIPITYTYFK